MINPNSDRDEVNRYKDKNLQCQVNDYPLFFESLTFEKFRHISNLTVDFKNPITVITGSNKAGKTSILLTIACSHYNFHKRNITTGVTEKTRWGDVMRFTSQDIQTEDWTYYVKYREGEHEISKRGQRKYATRKWNGVAKKESQIGTPTKSHLNGGRNVILIDLERIVPARHLSVSIFNKAKNEDLQPLDPKIDEYLSYILEMNYEVGKMYSYSDSALYGYNSIYSSYNTASGEDALTSMLKDIIEAPDNALILIEEVEVGLHPKIQRRLIDILYHESKKTRKQFIITTHSSTILSSVNPESRIFIENNNGSFRSIQNISINATLSKMDSHSYPLVNVYVEDDISKDIVNKAINKIVYSSPGFNRLINVVIVGPANKTYEYFRIKSQLYQNERINCGYACVLDGDMKNKKNKDGELLYHSEELLFFHYSNLAPETMLVKAYLENRPNSTLKFHVSYSNAHNLFQKMVELGLCTSKDEAFNSCWCELLKMKDGQTYFQKLQDFLINSCKHFSNDL